MINILQKRVNEFTISSLFEKTSYNPPYYLFKFTDVNNYVITVNLTDDSSFSNRYSVFTIIDGSIANFRASGSFKIYENPIDSSILDASSNFLDEGMYTFYRELQEDIVYDPSLFTQSSIDYVFDPLFDSEPGQQYTPIDHNVLTNRNLPDNHPQYVKDASLGESSFFYDASGYLQAKNIGATIEYVDGSLSARDTSIAYLNAVNNIQDVSITDLYLKNLNQDASITELRIYTDGSLSARDTSIAYLNTVNNIQDVSITDLYLKNLIQDSSITELRIYTDGSLSARDTSIAYLNTVNNIQDVSITDLYLKNLIQDSSLTSLKAINDIQDVSISDLYTKNLNQDASITDLIFYVDGSLANLDASISGLVLKNLNQDVSITDLRTYTDGSLNNKLNNTTDTFTGNLTINGSLNIFGNIYQDGSSYIVDVEEIRSADDFIIMRNGNTMPLADGSISGIEIIKADGSTNVVLGTGNDAVMRVGWKGDTLQAITTREDTPTNQWYTYWDDSSSMLKTGNLVGYIDGSLINRDGSISELRTYLDGNFYNLEISKDTHFTTGFVNRIDSSLSFNNSDRVFTISPTVTSYEIYVNSIPFIKTADASVQIPNTVGLHFIYYDINGVLQTMTTSWSIISSIVPAAIIYWNGSAGTVMDERHSAGRNLEWHVWAHTTVGARYKSGLNATFTTSTMSVDGGEIADEDIQITSGIQTQNRIWYRSGSVMTFDNTLANFAAKVTAGVLQYDNNGTLTNVPNNNYVCNHLYATNEVGNNLMLVTSQFQGTLANARIATLPTFPNLPTPELKLIWRIIYRNAGGVPTYIEKQDYRTATTLPGGATGSVSAAGVSFIPSGTISATDVQAAINELDSEIYSYVDSSLNLRLKEASLNYSTFKWNGGLLEPSTAGGERLDSLLDVSILGLVDDDILLYNASTGLWENVNTVDASTLFWPITTALLKETSLNYSTFKWNGGLLEPSTAGGSGATTLAGLTDVTLTNASTNDVLVYDGSEWENITSVDLSTLLVDIATILVDAETVFYSKSVIDASFATKLSLTSGLISSGYNLETVDMDASILSGIDASGNLKIKKLKGLGAADIIDYADYITIGIDASFSGENNTASNIFGGDASIFKQKTFVDLEFRSLKSKTPQIILTTDASFVFVDVSLAPSGATTLSGLTDVSIVNASTGNVLMYGTTKWENKPAVDISTVLVDIATILVDAATVFYSKVQIDASFALGLDVSNNYAKRLTSFTSCISGYTVNASDNNGVIDASGTYTIIFPDSLSTGFSTTVFNIGSGILTLNASTLICSDSSVRLISLGDAATVIHRGSGIFYASGKLN